MAVNWRPMDGCDLNLDYLLILLYYYIGMLLDYCCIAVFLLGDLNLENCFGRRPSYEPLIPCFNLGLTSLYELMAILGYQGTIKGGHKTRFCSLVYSRM